MLKMFFSVSPLDVKAKNFLYDPTAYYIYGKKKGWILAPPFKDIISDIDNSDIVADGVLYQREYDITYSDDRLSGGTHMLLIMYHVHDSEKIVYDLNACGNNCAKWLPSITSDRDVICRLGYPMDIVPTEDWPVLCMNSNTMMYSEEDYIEQFKTWCDSNAEEVIFPEGYV